MLGEDEVPVAVVCIAISQTPRARLATELLRNSAPVMKHGGLGHPKRF